MFRILLLLSGVSLKISGGFVAAAIIGLVVSSLRPLASPACTHSFRDAASMGSGQLRYCVVASSKSCKTSFVEGTFIFVCALSWVCVP